MADPVTHALDYKVLGIVTHIAMQSSYRHWWLSDLEANIVPPLRLGQYKIFLDDAAQPRAFVTWALVDDECHRNMLAGKNPPADRWCSGSHLWFTDVVAPFGDLKLIAGDMRAAFPGHDEAHSMRVDVAGKLRKVIAWKRTRADSFR